MRRRCSRRCGDKHGPPSARQTSSDQPRPPAASRWRCGDSGRVASRSRRRWRKQRGSHHRCSAAAGPEMPISQHSSAHDQVCTAQGCRKPREARLYGGRVQHHAHRATKCLWRQIFCKLRTDRASSAVRPGNAAPDAAELRAVLQGLRLVDVGHALHSSRTEGSMMSEVWISPSVRLPERPMNAEILHK